MEMVVLLLRNEFKCWMICTTNWPDSSSKHKIRFIVFVMMMNTSNQMEHFTFILNDSITFHIIKLQIRFESINYVKSIYFVLNQSTTKQPNGLL